jgi:Recombination endonuclease VII
MKRVFGINERQYQEMLKRQGGVCAICSNPPKKIRLAVEHDHGPSKRVRGACCWTCNFHRIGRNTVETARKVLAYLESTFDARNL